MKRLELAASTTQAIPRVINVNFRLRIFRIFRAFQPNLNNQSVVSVQSDFRLGSKIAGQDISGKIRLRKHSPKLFRLIISNDSFLKCKTNFERRKSTHMERIYCSRFYGESQVLVSHSQKQCGSNFIPA